MVSLKSILSNILVSRENTSDSPPVAITLLIPNSLRKLVVLLHLVQIIPPFSSISFSKFINEGNGETGKFSAS